MIWLIHKDFLRRHWWLLAIAFGPQLLSPYWIWTMFLIQWLWGWENRGKSFDVLANLPVHHASLGRAYWIWLMAVPPAIAGIAYGLNAPAGGLFESIDSSEVFITQQVIVMGVVAGWLLVLTFVRKSFHSALLIPLGVGAFLLLRRIGHGPLDAYGVIVSIVAIVLVLASFIVAPRLSHLATKHGSPLKSDLGSPFPERQKVQLRPGSRYWDRLRLWLSPTGFLLLGTFAPLLSVVPIYARTGWHAAILPIPALAVGIFFGFMFQLRASFYWLECLRALRVLPMPRRTLAYILASSPAVSGVLASLFAIPILVAVGAGTISGVAGGYAAGLSLVFMGCLVHVRWGATVANGAVAGSIAVAMILLMLGLFRHGPLAGPIGHWLPVLILVMLLVYGVRYLERLLLTRSYR